MAENAINLQDLPAIISMGELTYDLNEIEHQFYMFDHRMVGCVTLLCTRPMKRESGTVTIDGIKVDNWFLADMNFGEYGKQLTVVVPVRGILREYGKTYQLTLTGFIGTDGTAYGDFSFQIKTNERPQIDPAYAEHDRIARLAAEEGIVLLKNEDSVLPLSHGSVLNLFGAGVTNFRISAAGAGRINPRFTRSLREAVRETTDFILNPELDEFYQRPTNAVPSEDIFKKAKERSDTGIFVLTRGSGENMDNRPVPGEYYLSAEEEALLDAVSRHFKNTIVILNTGYPVSLNWMKKYPVAGLLYVGLAGQAGAEALCEILDGRVNPSGKLTDTWAWDYHDIPASVNFYNPKPEEAPILADDGIWADTCYEEGIYVGYRYFETFGKDVAFCFGHGLSYTSFALEDVSLDEKGNVSVTVVNTGSRAGKEVVQVYAGLPGTHQEQPVKQLVAFAKTDHLAPGERQRLVLPVGEKQLSTYSEELSAWVREAGETRLYVGTSVNNARYFDSVLEEELRVVRKVNHHLPCPVAFEELSQRGKQWPTGELTCIRGEAGKLSYPLPRDGQEEPSLPEYHGERIVWEQVRQNPALLDDFTAQMSVEELARLNVLYGAGWTMDGKGEAGRMAPIPEYGMPDYICSDGNCGVNIYRPNIGMPSTVLLCQSFNPELAFAVGKTIGEEARENGIQMILATAMNIHRNPLNGRQPEYFSEDPYLSGVMAAGQVRGLHSAGVSDSIKHVACNNCETARKSNHSLVKERALREIYLRGFEILIDLEKPDTIMTGYNAMNGSMCGSDPVLIDRIFREDLGFDGFAMTDWNSYDTVDMVEAVQAGISWLTPGENDGSRVAVLLKAAEEGRLSRAALERNAKRVFAVMLRRGF
ncbi:MAG: glycoside hydrolase family 3 C-terminal domain-containing protein [Lachnospiraceae bacterium]|nr:glycoside hydrolase family 3 C-terminal domain-containing protein [Lachnospiraceae bacterium]